MRFYLIADGSNLCMAICHSSPVLCRFYQSPIKNVGSDNFRQLQRPESFVNCKINSSATSDEEDCFKVIFLKLLEIVLTRRIVYASSIETKQMEKYCISCYLRTDSISSIKVFFPKNFSMCKKLSTRAASFSSRSSFDFETLIDNSVELK